MAAAGDIGSDGDGVATLKAMAAAKPDVVLGLGDLSYGGPGSEAAWCQLVTTQLGATPMQLVSGNHEDDTGRDGRIANFTACLPDRMRSTGRYGSEYYFDLEGTARVIMISPDLTIGGEYFYYGERNERVQWLESAIDSARSAQMPWVIVGMHKNCLSVGPYDCKIYEELLNVLSAKKVDLVLHGHDHTYQRTRQLGHSDGCSTMKVDSYDQRCVVDPGAGGAYSKGKGTVFVVSGAGGRELYEINQKDPEAGYFATWMGANENPRKGFTKLTMTPERLNAQFVGSTETSNYSDEFSITSRP